jgi:hypothetical protein
LATTVGLLDDHPSNGGNVRSVIRSGIPRIESIRLHGCKIFLANHSLGLGEDGNGDSAVGFRLLSVSFRLLQERFPNDPFVRQHLAARASLGEACNTTS